MDSTSMSMGITMATQDRTIIFTPNPSTTITTRRSNTQRFIPRKSIFKHRTATDMAINDWACFAVKSIPSFILYVTPMYCTLTIWYLDSNTVFFFKCKKTFYFYYLKSIHPSSYRWCLWHLFFFLNAIIIFISDVFIITIVCILLAFLYFDASKC